MKIKKSPEPIAPSGLSVKPLADLRLKISLGSETQDFTAKIVGAKIEWSSVKQNNGLFNSYIRYNSFCWFFIFLIIYILISL